MIDSPRAGFMDAVFETVDQSIGSIGFSPIDRREWRRPAGWKTDSVVLIAKELYFMINLYVSIPPEPGTPFESASLALANLGSIAGHGTAEYRYPRWLRGSAVTVLGQVRKDMECARKWFERFGSPRACREYLRSIGPADTAVCRPGSHGFEYCMRYLEAVKESDNT
jgi:hypothetical protein